MLWLTRRLGAAFRSRGHYRGAQDEGRRSAPARPNVAAAAAPDMAAAMPAPGHAHAPAEPCTPGLHPQGRKGERLQRGHAQQQGEVVHASYYGEAISGREISPRRWKHPKRQVIASGAGTRDREAPRSPRISMPSPAQENVSGKRQHQRMHRKRQVSGGNERLSDLAISANLSANLYLPPESPEG
jgi:hypothetical protein